MFSCTDPESSFVFDTAKRNSSHWYGSELDKLGTYKVVEAEQLNLELQWTCSREQACLVVSTEGEGDEMPGFILKNNQTGKLYCW